MADSSKFKWAVHFCLAHGITFKKYPSPVHLLKSLVRALKNAGKMARGTAVYDNAPRKDAPGLLEFLCDALPEEYRVSNNRGMFRQHKARIREKKVTHKGSTPKAPDSTYHSVLKKWGASFVKSADFLSTKEWKRVRMDAIEKYSNVCMICGRRPPEISINVDHIVPRALDWKLALTVDNLQILCAECNEGKGNRYTTDYRPE